jgi:hypothetical protein
MRIILKGWKDNNEQRDSGYHTEVLGLILFRYMNIPLKMPQGTGTGRPSQTDPTPLSRKYGQPRFGLHAKLNGTAKSGITPLPMTNAPGLSPTARDFIGDMEDYQRARFRGFTAQELDTLDSMAALYPDGSRPIADRLENPLFPLYDRIKWDTEGSIPKHIAPWQLGKGRDGYWLVHHFILLFVYDWDTDQSIG